MIGSIQREILSALIQLYEKKKRTIKGEEIAEILHRTPGTVRNQMQMLKALGYVDGVPGPKGGYTPAMKAYESLGMEVIKKPRTVSVYRNGKAIGGLKVQKMIFSQVPHPTQCKAVITIIGDTKKIADHDIIKVGPTPVNHVILRGEVVGREDSRGMLLISAHSITSIPKGKVEDIATTELISLPPDITIRDCARELVNNRIRAVPVIDEGKLVGIITAAEIVKAVALGREDNPIWDIVVKNPLTIDAGSELIDSIEKMKKHDIGRLIVMRNGKAVGMITRTDILMRMLE